MVKFWQVHREYAGKSPRRARLSAVVNVGRAVARLPKRALGVYPLVTVVVPTCRRPGRLVGALDSILNQTYDKLEVIVINDNDPGSCEDVATERVLSSYGSDPRVKTMHTAGLIGGGAARNAACKEAQGEYLAFLDDDDYFLDDKIQTQLEFMLENDLEMSWQDVSWYNDDGKLIEHRRLDHCTDFSRDGLFRAHLLTPIAPTSIYMLTKSLFERTDGFGEVRTGQDWWLMLRCIETGARIGYMPGVHVHQIIHKDGRLSLGTNKLEGEMERHEVVKGYYSRIQRRDVRYIEFRHNAVLAFSSYRSGDLGGAVKFGSLAFASSPTSCITEGLKYFTLGKHAS